MLTGKTFGQLLFVGRYCCETECTKAAFLKLFSSGDHFHYSERSTDHPNLGIIKLIRPALNSVRNMFL